MANIKTFTGGFGFKGTSYHSLGIGKTASSSAYTAGDIKFEYEIFFSEGSTLQREVVFKFRAPALIRKAATGESYENGSAYVIASNVLSFIDLNWKPENRYDIVDYATLTGLKNYRLPYPQIFRHLPKGFIDGR